MTKKKLKNKINKSKKQVLKGFSLGEVLLSVFILGTVMTAALGLMASNLRYMINSQDQVIATGLAQEGTELVLNLRDNNWENGREAFFNGTNSYFPNNNDAIRRIDYNDGRFYNASLDRIYLRNNFYCYSPLGTPTKYRRRVIVNYYDGSGNSTNRASAESAKITSVVIWGNSFPNTTNIDKSNCNINNKCAFSIITLYKWQ